MKKRIFVSILKIIQPIQFQVKNKDEQNNQSKIDAYSTTLLHTGCCIHSG